MSEIVPVYDEVRESRSRWINPESWTKAYRGADLCSSLLFYIGIVVVVFLSLKFKCSILPISVVWGALLTIPMAHRLVLVYKISQILDVDGDPQRFADTLDAASKNVSWFQKGWLLTEQARAQIALGDYPSAKEILNSDEMKHGMSQFYVARRVELLGICAILEHQDMDYFENELEVLANTPRKCGCVDNYAANIIRIKRNWDYLQEVQRPW